MNDNPLASLMADEPVPMLDETWRDDMTHRASGRNALRAQLRAVAPSAVFEAIAHGDDDHRDWLREACDNIFAGKPVPEPRGSNTSSALRGKMAELEAREQALLARVAELETVLRQIADLDPEHSSEGHNEWGEAEMFARAQEIARESLA